MGIAKDMKVRVEKGEIDEVISLIKKATELQHFQNLEIGQKIHTGLKLLYRESFAQAGRVAKNVGI